MKVAVFSTKPYDEEYLQGSEFSGGVEFTFYETSLSLSTLSLCKGFSVISLFVNDDAKKEVLCGLKEVGVSSIVLRCAGYNNVDIQSAKELGIHVFRVPAYSPHAVAEHALALMLSLNRKIPKAFMRVREGNFSLSGLMGFDMYGKTVGIIGVGKIGKALARILKGMGCHVLGIDQTHRVGECDNGVEYVSLETLLRRSSVISLHCPLTPKTYHLINDETLEMTKKGVMIINTGRGGLIDTQSVIRSLKKGHIGYLGLDVYEQECGIFFEDLSEKGIEDDTIARLVTFPNVIVTSHQGFFTHEAMCEIAHVTCQNIVGSYNGVVDPAFQLC